MIPQQEITIASQGSWFKIVAFLQQNWALMDEAPSGVTVWFLGDTGGVFDQLDFPSREIAKCALRRNRFRRFAEDAEVQSFLAPPAEPFHRHPHPNGPIYSSGRFWT